MHLRWLSCLQAMVLGKKPIDCPECQEGRLVYEFDTDKFRCDECCEDIDATEYEMALLCNGSQILI